MHEEPRKNTPACDLCGDQPAMIHLHSRCHLTAPLSATLHGDVLVLCCYLPDCNREVARFKIVGMVYYPPLPTDEG